MTDNLLPDNEDLGSDFSCVTDINASLSTTSGRNGLAEALCRRLGTPREGLWYDRTYGYDLRDLVGTTLNLPQATARTRDQCLLDERVIDAEVTFEQTGTTLTVTLRVTDADGTFTFTLDVSELTVELLSP